MNTPKELERKGKSSKTHPEASQKIGVSMPAWLLSRARERAHALGYSTFSAYIQALIHQDCTSKRPHERVPLDPPLP